jgi:hypothetical protein
MAQVRVWNDNIHPYQETFREKELKIPAKSFILMDSGDAHLFKGTFAPIKVDADGNPIAQGYKMIRIEKTAEPLPETKVKETICQACRYEASSDKDLAEHVKASHGDVALRDDEAEQEIERRKRAKKVG